MYLMSLIGLFACFFMFAGCSKDDENGDGNGLVGKWQLVKSSDKDAEACMFEGYVEFTSKGKYIDKTACGNENGNGTWSQSGSEVTITADILPIPMTGKIKELSETTLVLEMEFMGYKNSDTYKRVK